MTITRENDEIIIRIPESESDLDITELQGLLDYIIYRRIVSKSTATQEQIDELSREVNSSWWSENKHRFLPE
jgi:hypothetical protein